MTKSQELYKASLPIIPGGVHSPVRAFKSVGGTPVFFRRAEGAYLESVDGQRYIDFCQSFGPNILGHRDPDVQKEVELAVKDAWCFGACDPYSLELCQWIVSRSFHIDKLRLVCTGTEAVMSIIRIARAATRRNKILKFNGCYHGHVDGMLVKAGSGLASLAVSDSAGVSDQTAQDTIVCELNDEEAVYRIFKAHGPDIAAVMIEPLPANYGLLIQRPEWIHFICDIAKRNGSLVVFDEVISGFRVHLNGMAELLQTKPDLVAYGKVIGGGFPVAAYGGRVDLMDLVAPLGSVYQAGTLAANPVAVRAGLATLKKLENLNVIKILEQRANQFQNSLNKRLADADIPVMMTRVGSIFWLHPNIGLPIRTPKEFTADQKILFANIFHEALRRGVYLSPSAFEVNFTSLAHTEEILNTAEDVIFEAAKIATNRGRKK